MKIYCDYCGQTWEVYAGDEPMRPSASRCPHCGASKVKPETWKEMIDCLKHVQEVNMILASDHANERYIPFEVSYGLPAGCGIRRRGQDPPGEDGRVFRGGTSRPGLNPVTGRKHKTQIPLKYAEIRALCSFPACMHYGSFAFRYSASSFS